MDNKIKESTSFLLFALFFALFTIVPVMMFFESLESIDVLEAAYDDFLYKEFTVECVEVRRDSEMGARYIITVYEEEKKLIVNNLLTEIEVCDKLDLLESGDKVYCYVIDKPSQYEIVEIKTDEISIIPLYRYQQIYYKQGVLGLIIAPFLFIVCCVCSVVGIIVSFIERKKEKTIEQLQ